jgi:hypothetical protein
MSSSGGDERRLSEGWKRKCHGFKVFMAAALLSEFEVRKLNPEWQGDGQTVAEAVTLGNVSLNTVSTHLAINWVKVAILGG